MIQNDRRTVWHREGRREDAALAPRIDLEPRSALFDEPVHVRVGGLAPGQQVVLRAEMRDDAGAQWQSHASFRADRGGTVDLRAQPALEGTYSGLDPLGLFWSMRVASEDPTVPFTKTGFETTPMVFTAETGGRVVARASLERSFIHRDVTRQDVHEDGLEGEFFLPARPGPGPAVIVLAGWPAGGILRHSAALLASRGYAALALGYFRYGSLPKRLSRIPLEYFGTAIDWLSRHPRVDAERLGVIGYSKGGELALMLGATFPQLRAIVAYAPSGIVLECGGGAPFGMRGGGSPWSWGGAALPYLRCGPTAPQIVSLVRSAIGGTPFRTRPLVDYWLRDTVAAHRATIPVERIRGPVLLVTGQDDQILPAGELAEQLRRRLEDHDPRFPVEHVSYEGAGHEIWFSHAGLPSGMRAVRAPGFAADLGGTAEADATARVESWARVRNFLEASLGH